VKKSWEMLSVETKHWMERLGNFGLCRCYDPPLIKGYVFRGEEFCGKTYFGSEDLREIAASLIKVADWLDQDEPEAPMEIPERTDDG